MATPKGYTTLDNSSPMAGPAQINAAELFVENLIGESKPTVADLPASGNWPGRRILVAADGGRDYAWSGSKWLCLGGVGLSATFVRATTDNYAINTTVPLGMDVNIPNAPAGKYLASGVLILKSTVANGGNLTITINGANYSTATLDTGPVTTHVPVSLIVAHTGGTLTFGVSDARTAGTCTIYAASRTNLAFLGPS